MSLESNPILKSSKVKVGITMGDPSGVGPAATLKAVGALAGVADFVVIGDARVLALTQRVKQKTKSFKLVDLENVALARFSFGRICPEYGRASIQYLDKSMELLKDGSIDCLVTAPISKEAIGLAGFHYSGHTEYLAEKSGVKDVTMMLLNDKLTFTLATRHVPLKNVSARITRGAFSRTVLSTDKTLKRYFACPSPRIVVCGLNPHASDNGVIGKEENSVIKPVVRRLRARVKGLQGPFSADVAIYKMMKGEYDCAIAMYHDQALIPLKLSGFDTGVNMTLDLPFVRTSPLHGTGFDIAARPDRIDPRSLIAAIRLAIRCSRNLKKA